MTLKRQAEICYVRGNGQVTLPVSLRRQASLEEGDPLQAEVRADGSVALRPIATIDRLELDLLRRLESDEDVQSLLGPDDRQGLNARQVARSAAKRLDNLLDQYRRDNISRKHFIGQAMALGLSPSVIATLVVAKEPEAREGSLEGLPDSGEASDAPDKSASVHIRQAFQSLLYLPLYIARAAGFFEEEGVTVEVTSAGGGPEAWSTVSAGLADYSIHDPVFAVRAYERGHDAVVVGTVCNALAVLAAAKDPEIEATADPREFITKTVANRTVSTQPEPDSQWAVLNYLGFLYDVKMGRVYRNLQVPIGTEMEPVISGTSDIGTSFPPAADVALAEGLHEVFDFSRFFGPFALSALCTRRSFIQKNPELHQAVINAFEKACQFAYAFPEEAIEIAIEEFPGEDPAVIRQSARRCLRRGFVPQHIYVDSEAWRESQTVHKFIGNLEAFHDRSETVNNEAALHAYRMLGQLSLHWHGPGPVGEERGSRAVKREHRRTA